MRNVKNMFSIAIVACAQDLLAIYISPLKLSAEESSKLLELLAQTTKRLRHVWSSALRPHII